MPLHTAWWRKWTAEFKRGKESLEDDPCLRRPHTMIIQETIAKIHSIIMADRRVTERFIATELGISQERIYTVIHNELHMSIVSQNSYDLWWTRLNMSRENLVIFKADPHSCFSEIWKRAEFITSNQRRSKLEAVETPRLSVSQESQRLWCPQVMASIFWDA